MRQNTDQAMDDAHVKTIRSGKRGAFLLKLVDYFGLFICIIIATIITYWLIEKSFSVSGWSQFNRGIKPDYSLYLIKLLQPLAFTFFGACFAIPVLRQRWKAPGQWTFNWFLCLGTALPVFILTLIYILADFNLLRGLLGIETSRYNSNESFLEWLYHKYTTYKEYSILVMMWLGYLLLLCFDKKQQSAHQIIQVEYKRQ